MEVRVCVRERELCWVGLQGQHPPTLDHMVPLTKSHTQTPHQVCERERRQNVELQANLTIIL